MTLGSVSQKKNAVGEEEKETLHWPQSSTGAQAGAYKPSHTCTQHLPHIHWMIMNNL